MRAVADVLLHVDGLTKRFGGVVASDNVRLDVTRGELHAIIGPNGAGKTTLIGQLAGEIVPDAGRIHFGGQDITALPVHGRSLMGLARTFQITSCFRISLRWITWRWRCRRMPGTRSGCGARPAQKMSCKSPPGPRSNGWAWVTARTPCLEA